VKYCGGEFTKTKQKKAGATRSFTPGLVRKEEMHFRREKLLEGPQSPVKFRSFPGREKNGWNKRQFFLKRIIFPGVLERPNSR